ncbi:YebC/PmpR family DNA-binding transcriptional regulator [Heliorestis acidaminivorans]|uniref:Probable transcriptional regulatory protein F9B85_12825 n=1 Tax=Heliorestis acidaminivorans TaxID=553427 RepID=A0A6I0EXD8_9FIRM|nr:YebC/PmpR family DNA-binding transcriptional regulator [Heliorestis acidaminivorans]KAB2951247.1 YebC/PmpR family DNA-binding transcriptional regulator [Heliorestis acidaminivorans]
MAGHSKWANIKHKKAKVDAQRGKIFTKLSREIIVAARQGGADPNGNFRLKIAIQKAKEANLPNDNIQRAIQRATGGGDSVNYEELSYEGYGPGGVAVLIEAMTDNRNRTASEIRHLFTKYGGNLGESGCVAWMFDRKGLIRLEGDPEKGDQPFDEEEVMLQALEAGALDLQVSPYEVEIYTTAEQLEEVKEAIAAQGYQVATAEITMLPQNTVEITEKEQAQKLLRFMEMLDEQDDVQNSYANFDLSESLMKELE